MRFPCLSGSLLILLLLALTNSSILRGEGPRTFRPQEFGFRAGSSIPRGDDFRQYDLFVIWRTPWHWIHPIGNVGAFVEAHTGGGLLRNPDNRAGFAYAGPGVRVATPRFPAYVSLASVPAYLTRSRFGDVDFGQRLQFISSASITWMMTPEIGLRYRIQHMSNARLATPNPGLDTHSAGIVIAF